MIILDVETTGHNPKRNSIVSLGALDFSNPLNQFYLECRAWNNAEVEEFALKINGFSERQVRDPNKIAPISLVTDFLIWTESIAEKTIAGENPTFDTGFLEDILQRCGKKWPLGYRTIDLHTLSYSHYLMMGLNPPLKNNRTDLSLNKTLVYVGLPEEPNPHNALTGAKMEAEAFSRIIYGKIFLEEFKQYKIPEYLKK